MVGVAAAATGAVRHPHHVMQAAGALAIMAIVTAVGMAEQLQGP
ncbi:hypothetical protein ACI01nite_02380 [Acetobacter cibinongensis]|uniref:Uncharacterized protein n=1 Tax=Acetobacter cibinongensis TaxID=146475 RepID=A0A0D6N3C2_9PROT|nr:hypothetical protein Abci_008_149 [Acetobacter cibinongensis]GEL57636.1 hypothetical protein ACI01nite_02380 [Acetobacter cibinongensis]